jgi:hypothetical protein
MPVASSPSPEFDRVYVNEKIESTPPMKACQFCQTDVTSDPWPSDADGGYSCKLCNATKPLNGGVPFGFRARRVENLDQGDHVCIKLTYLRRDGTIKNLGHTIMPDVMAKEYLWHMYYGPNYSE